MGDINISINEFICSSQQAHRPADEETVESRSSAGGFFISQTSQTTGHWEDLSPGAPLPGKDFLQTMVSPSSPAGPCFQSPHQKGLLSHPISKSRPPTPASGHSPLSCLVFLKNSQLRLHIDTVFLSPSVTA